MTGIIIFCLGTVIAMSLSFFAHTMAAKKQLKKRLGSQRISLPSPAHNKTKSQGPAGPMLALHYFLLSAGLRLSPKIAIMVPLSLAVVTAGGVLGWTGQLIPALFTGIVILGMPILYLFWKRREIQRRIITEMPDALGMVVRSLRIGMGVDSALKEAGESLVGPLGMEIKIIYRETAMGIPFAQAFLDFAKRYPALPDVKLFCTAFILQRETGGNLAELLQSLANTIQDRFTFKRQIKTYTAEARMSAIIISLLPFMFALVAWLMNPNYLSKLTGTPLGRCMIYAAVGLEIAGFLVMRKMAKVKI
jgi:tight adherence protein B